MISVGKLKAGVGVVVTFVAPLNSLLEQEIARVEDAIAP